MTLQALIQEIQEKYDENKGILKKIGLKKDNILVENTKKHLQELINVSETDLPRRAEKVRVLFLSFKGEMQRWHKDQNNISASLSVFPLLVKQLSEIILKDKPLNFFKEALLFGDLYFLFFETQLLEDTEVWQDLFTGKDPNYYYLLEAQLLLNRKKTSILLNSSMDDESVFTTDDIQKYEQWIKTDALAMTSPHHQKRLVYSLFWLHRNGMCDDKYTETVHFSHYPKSIAFGLEKLKSQQLDSDENIEFLKACDSSAEADFTKTDWHSVPETYDLNAKPYQAAVLIMTLTNIDPALLSVENKQKILASRFSPPNFESLTKLLKHLHKAGLPTQTVFDTLFDPQYYFLLENSDFILNIYHSKLTPEFWDKILSTKSKVVYFNQLLQNPEVLDDILPLIAKIITTSDSSDEVIALLRNTLAILKNYDLLTLEIRLRTIVRACIAGISQRLGESVEQRELKYLHDLVRIPDYRCIALVGLLPTTDVLQEMLTEQIQQVSDELNIFVNYFYQVANVEHIQALIAGLKQQDKSIQKQLFHALSCLLRNRPDLFSIEIKGLILDTLLKFVCTPEILKSNLHTDPITHRAKHSAIWLISEIANQYTDQIMLEYIDLNMRDIVNILNSLQTIVDRRNDPMHKSKMSLLVAGIYSRDDKTEDPERHKRYVDSGIKELQSMENNIAHFLLMVSFKTTHDWECIQSAIADDSKLLTRSVAQCLIKSLLLTRKRESRRVILKSLGQMKQDFDLLSNDIKILILNFCGSYGDTTKMLVLNRYDLLTAEEIQKLTSERKRTLMNHDIFSTIFMPIIERNKDLIEDFDRKFLQQLMKNHYFSIDKLLFDMYDDGKISDDFLVACLDELLSLPTLTDDISKFIYEAYKKSSMLADRSIKLIQKLNETTSVKTQAYIFGTLQNMKAYYDFLDSQDKDILMGNIGIYSFEKNFHGYHEQGFFWKALVDVAQYCPELLSKDDIIKAKKLIDNDSGEPKFLLAIMANKPTLLWIITVQEALNRLTTGRLDTQSRLLKKILDILDDESMLTFLDNPTNQTKFLLILKAVAAIPNSSLLRWTEASRTSSLVLSVNRLIDRMSLNMHDVQISLTPAELKALDNADNTTEAFKLLIEQKTIEAVDSKAIICNVKGFAS